MASGFEPTYSVSKVQSFNHYTNCLNPGDWLSNQKNSFLVLRAQLTTNFGTLDKSYLGSLLFRRLVVSGSLRPPWTVACQASLSFTISWSLLKLMSIQSVTPFSYSVFSFSSCLHTFSASGSFLMTRFFASSGQSIGASVSASGLPMNI